MSHAQQIKAAKIMSNALSFSPEHSVLEIGSYDVNGTVRAIFNSSDYTGIDLVSGPTVNEVVSGHEINFLRKFDFVISFECFEKLQGGTLLCTVWAYLWLIPAAYPHNKTPGY